MGLPINPDDPRDGGCPVCVPFIPQVLRVFYRFQGVGDYNGDIIRSVPVPTVWAGILTSPSSGPKSFGLQFCISGTFDILLTITGRLGFTIVDAHCDFPLAGIGNGGDVFFVRRLF